MKIKPLHIFNPIQKRNRSISPEVTRTFNFNAKQHKIGQFEIGKTLGQGTFGKVKLAHHIQTKEKVRNILIQGSY